jgi:hypothetical protein
MGMRLVSGREGIIRFSVAALDDVRRRGLGSMTAGGAMTGSGRLSDCMRMKIRSWCMVSVGVASNGWCSESRPPLFLFTLKRDKDDNLRIILVGNSGTGKVLVIFCIGV